METTTVKLQKTTKSTLDHFKQHHESYDAVISRLMNHVNHKKMKTDLIKAYQAMGKEDLQILNEWEAASREL